MPVVATDKPHLGTALTGAAVLFVLLRLLAVSHHDRRAVSSGGSAGPAPTRC